MKLVGALLATVGGLILLLALWYAVEASRFIINSESATGVIVEHEFTSGLITSRGEVGSAGRTAQVTDMYAPVVRFETSDGGEIRFKANWSEGEPPTIGTEVGVRYPTQSPEDARIAGISSLYGGAGVLLVIGGIFLGAGIFVLRRSETRKAV